MIRTVLTGFVALAVLGVGVLIAPSPAKALSKEEIFRRCAENIEKEFGEADVKFKTFRRNGNREMAFGELEMKDGSTRPIRCRVRHGRQLDVRFKGGSGAGNDAWTADRPENAGFIKPEEPEKPDAEAEQETEESAANEPERRGPVRRSVGGDEPSGGSATKEDDQSEAPTTGDDAAQTDPDQASGNSNGEDSNGAAAAADKPEEEKRNGPVFRKVQTQ